MTSFQAEQSIQTIILTLEQSKNGTNEAQAQANAAREKFSLEMPEYAFYLTCILSSMKTLPATTRQLAGFELIRFLKAKPPSFSQELRGKCFDVVLQSLGDELEQIRITAGSTISAFLDVIGFENGFPFIGQLLTVIQGNEAHYAEGASSCLVKIVEDNEEKMELLKLREKLETLVDSLIGLCKTAKIAKVLCSLLTALKTMCIASQELFQNKVENYLTMLLTCAGDQNPLVRTLVLESLTVLIHFPFGPADAPQDEHIKPTHPLLPQSDALIDFALICMDSPNEHLEMAGIEFWQSICENWLLLEASVPKKLDTIIPRIITKLTYTATDLYQYSGFLKEDSEIADPDQAIPPAVVEMHSSQSVFGDSNPVSSMAQPQASLSSSSSSSSSSQTDADTNEEYDEIFQSQMNDVWTPRKSASCGLEALATALPALVVPRVIQCAISLMAVVDTPSPAEQATAGSISSSSASSSSSQASEAKAVIDAPSASKDTAKWKQRECGVFAAGIVAKASLSSAAPFLPQLLPWLIHSVNDAHPLVRMIACWALGKTSVWVCGPLPDDESWVQIRLQEDAAREEATGEKTIRADDRKWLAEVLNALSIGMLDKNKEVQRSACVALNLVVDECGPRIRPYSSLLLENVFRAFRVYQKANARHLCTLSASIVDAAGALFRSEEHLKPLMVALGDRLFALPPSDTRLIPHIMSAFERIVENTEGSAFMPFAPKIVDFVVRIVHDEVMKEKADFDRYAEKAYDSTSKSARIQQSLQSDYAYLTAHYEESENPSVTASLNFLCTFIECTAPSLTVPLLVSSHCAELIAVAASSRSLFILRSLFNLLMSITSKSPEFVTSPQPNGATVLSVIFPVVIDRIVPGHIKWDEQKIAQMVAARNPMAVVPSPSSPPLSSPTLSSSPSLSSISLISQPSPPLSSPAMASTRIGQRPSSTSGLSLSSDAAAILSAHHHSFPPFNFSATSKNFQIYFTVANSAVSALNNIIIAVGTHITPFLHSLVPPLAQLLVYLAPLVPSAKIPLSALPPETTVHRGDVEEFWEESEHRQQQGLGCGVQFGLSVCECMGRVAGVCGTEASKMVAKELDRAGTVGHWLWGIVHKGKNMQCSTVLVDGLCAVAEAELPMIAANPSLLLQTLLSISDMGIEYGKGSWHDEYKESAWIYSGGLPFNLTEGDLLAIFSQYGEISELNYPRDKETGKPRGFCFVKYEDVRSTVLAVDNLNGTSVLTRKIIVDHVKDYKRITSEDITEEELIRQSMGKKPWET
ncbi:putative RNA-binding motif protein, X-linked 2 [Monocercomonoides exilis]|uniref:putative RNA-binding motif protein, X-linked 2 n=1 Tax=Monocercomonoides exilis TaxID=2049356 RepID=UPI0035596F2F|nr:putative RNA-binding motif protein, X-linked 2 [Monocercomonoides exilis]|eukprot:MONOS_12271.1-p1 / transcript=MONOS_12271.1 / gene=MONOS_12271 / organism=Monocercomonoides_exilis_PA203 / gene_product=GK14925 / transcript_product=GK14925 / location=Mono_scaffold00668:27905-32983(-) / protein_length=1265 / sequence_SO=supercontig / SO=protein_coding / is_pseudo=false